MVNFSLASFLYSPRTRHDVHNALHSDAGERWRREKSVRVADARRYRSIIELVYETIPQIVFQTWLWLNSNTIQRKLVSRIELQISIGASAMHTLLSLLWIRGEARRRGVSIWRFLVFFMAGRQLELRDISHDFHRLDLSVGAHDLSAIRATDDSLRLLSRRLRAAHRDHEMNRNCVKQSNARPDVWKKNKNSDCREKRTLDCDTRSVLILPTCYENDVSVSTLRDLSAALSLCALNMRIELLTDSIDLRHIEQAYGVRHMDAHRHRKELWRQVELYVQACDDSFERVREFSSMSEWEETRLLLIQRRRGPPHTLALAGDIGGEHFQR